MSSRRTIIGAGFAARAAALPIAAPGARGKAGLWEITTRMNMPGRLASIPPDQLARMQAMGMPMPNIQAFTTQHCMTAEEVAADRPPRMRNAQDCRIAR